MTDDERDALIALVSRKRARAKTYVRMAQRDRFFSALASVPQDLPALTRAIRFELETPLVDGDPEKMADVEPWLAATAAREARAHLHELEQLPADASTLAREDRLVAIATDAAVGAFSGLGIILLWEWVTQRDARVCEKCGPLDGKIMRHDAISPLPLHPSCRCGLRPVVK